MKIFLLRHGTTEWNSKHKIQGVTDISLDEIGKKMAHETNSALFLREIGFDRVYSSPLKRARDTAAIVAPGIEIIEDDRLKELSFGDMEGRSVAELTADENSPFRYFKSDPRKYDELAGECEGAETLTQLCKRNADFMKTVIEPLYEVSPDDDILIAGHGAQSRALLMYVRGENNLAEFWGSGLLPNCGMAVFEYTNEKGYEILEPSIRLYSDELAAAVSALL
ncbi:MAG: histidine phosphatase family protein [Lachnospiraceae bacterium]|nr:histidine phosphatase family protein [Lachnospiraceae bacterium]